MNNEEIKENIKKSIAGNIVAQYELGMTYYRDYQAYLSRYKAHKEHEDYEAYLSRDKAFKLFRKAAKRGHKDAEIMRKRMRDNWYSSANVELSKHRSKHVKVA